MNKNQKKSLTTLKYGLKFLKNYRLRLLISIFWSVIFVMIPMQVPVITGILVDGLILSNSPGQPLLFYGIIDVGNTPQKVILFSLVSLTIVAIAYGITSHLRIASRSIISRNFAFDLQKTLVQKLEFLSPDVHSKYGSGDLLNRILIDINNVRPFVEAIIIKSISNIVAIIYPIWMIFVIDQFLGTVVSSILPILFFIIYGLDSKISKVSRQLRNNKAKLTSLLKENLDGIEIIQASNAEKFSIEKISKQIDKVEVSQVSGQRYYGMMMGFAWGLTGLGIALAWALGGFKVLSGEITLGQLIILTGFVSFAYAPIRRLTRTVKDNHRSLVAMRHIQEILETPSSIVEDINTVNLDILQGNIRYENVYFSYNKDKKNDVLNNITIDIPAKSLTGIVGRSGSGKSSLLKLIYRLHDPLTGSILIDGIDITQVSVELLRSHIAVVTQHHMIFNGTIRENIILSNPNASDEEVEQACINADIFKCINKFPKGLDTIIGQTGVHLSGGEVQRIAIARALLKKAKILLLDEPLSAIDPESVRSIMFTLYKLKKDMTIVISGHNRDVFGKIDNVIVIDNGKIVEIVQKGIMKRFNIDDNSSIVYSNGISNYTVCNNIDLPNDHDLMSSDVGSGDGSFVPLPYRQQNISKDGKQLNNLDYKTIGRSENQRPMNVIFIGEQFNPQLKVFIIAGQHGDEKYGRKAAERLINYLLNTGGSEFSNLCIAILVNANPDGSYKHRRTTELKIDMNRDHLLLNSEENKVIHNFISKWQPHLIIDVHNYPPKREYLDKKNYVFCKDIMIDIPSNLSIYKRLDKDQLSELIYNIQQDLDPYNFSCDRYVLINKKGKVRHSTDDIVDARNFLALRYNILTILVEAKEPLSKEKEGKSEEETTFNPLFHLHNTVSKEKKVKSEEEERSISSQYLSLLSILNWARNNIMFLKRNSHSIVFKQGDLVAIRVKYEQSKEPFRMNFQNILTKKIEKVDFPVYYSHLKPTLYARLPSAYAIPIDKDNVINILHRHGFKSERINHSKIHPVENYFILLNDTGVKDMEKSVSVILKKEDKDLYDYEVFPINQLGGHTIALLLEPQSEYGLYRYKEMDIQLDPGIEYPILRVL